ncbi:MAG TPA: N-acetylneuraminate synthase family protein [Verrucomicrobiae bacterium]|nr:N-acetylneuraminate synthase family protein [Verrucomicrobiae bacterium]
MIFFVAEIGVNWDGDFITLKDMLTFAKKLGCNAVKFQAYNEDIIKNHPQKSRLIKSAVSKTNVEYINKLASEVNIEWFCTPMYKEAVDFLEPYVKRFKIREADGRVLLENKSSKLIDRILSTKKEIIISSATDPSRSKYYNNTKIKWLYVVPKYPCSPSDLDFRDIKKFDGYSNHCPYIIAPLSAAVLGAKIIEVHMTSSKSKDYIDNAVSFDYLELENLVKMIRLYEKMIT